MKKERNIIKFDPKASVTKVELSRNQDKGQNYTEDDLKNDIRDEKEKFQF